jgi:8-oxo-dGTP pyrophosphatase MutT (NUDIX family)
MNKRITEKKSVGIACCRRKSGEVQILMVCRRCTYALDTFMLGKYNINSDSDIQELLNSMTADEKLILLSFDFKMVWYFWWVNNPVRRELYFRIESKYNAVINGDGARLKRLISKSKSGERIWEIPKGRKNYEEKNIHGAIREISEETGIPKEDYKLLNTKPITYDFTDCGVKYIMWYYIADTLSIKNIRDQYVSENVGEIGEIRWMGAKEISAVDHFNRLTTITDRVIRAYKKNA